MNRCYTHEDIERAARIIGETGRKRRRRKLNGSGAEWLHQCATDARGSPLRI